MPGAQPSSRAERLLETFLRGYARGEAAAVAPWIVGRRVLDLGAGEGYVAAALASESHRAIPATAVWVCGADVGPFRRVAIPYVSYDGANLPFADEIFDTTLLLLMLHHANEPERVLDEAIRVTRSRLVVMESVYRNRLDRFWLDSLDGRLNHLRHGGRMNAPLAFRTPDGWHALFISRGLRCVATHSLGPWWERLVHHPVLWALDHRPRR